MDIEHHIDAIKSIAPREISVIASIDVEPLSQALAMVLREVQSQGQLITGLRDEQAKQEALNEELRRKIDSLESRTPDKTHDEPVSIKPDLDSLEQRLAALEKDLPATAALPSATADKEREFNENGSIDGLTERVRALEDALRNLPKDAPSAQQPAPPAGGGVSKEDLDALSRRLNDKADRSELDAILSPPPATDNGNGEASPVASSGEIDSLRNLIKVLGERVSNKADQRALDDTNSQVDGLKGPLSDLQAQIDALESKLASLRKTINEVGGRVDLMEPEVKLIGQEMRSSVSELKEEIEDLKKRHILSSGDTLSSERDLALAPISIPASGGSDSDDLSRLIRDIQISLKSKVDGRDLAQLTDMVDDHATAIEALKKIAPQPSSEGKIELSSLQAEINALKDAIEGKADASKLVALALEAKAALAEGLAPKADRSDLDDLKLRVSMMSTASGADGGGGGHSEGLLDAIKAMLGDKADKADLSALKEAISDKTAHLEELCDDLAARLASLREALQSLPPPISSPVGYSLSPEVLDGKIDELAGQVGDLFAELQRLRSQRERDLAASNAAPPQQANFRQNEAQVTKPVEFLGEQKDAASKTDLDNLAKDIQNLRDQIDMTSHAINTIAVGLEPRAGQPANPLDSLKAQAGKEPRDARGAFDRLVKHVGSQLLKKKMDYFDPSVLNDLSVKAAAMETLIKSPAYNRLGAPDLGMKDLESQVKKLSVTVRQLKSSSPLQSTTGRLADPGDHAMLSGKPLMGYRCLACDRPLEGLDAERGPYLPTTQVVPRSNALPLVSQGQGNSPPMSPIDPKVSAPPSRPGIVDPNLVGPKLPPGGWRASQAGTPGSGLTYTRTSNTGEALPRI